MSMKQTITALDIGTSKIAVAIAVHDESEKLKVLGYGVAESAGVRKGVIVDIDQVTECLDIAIQKAERMAGVAAKDAFVSVGGPHIASQDSHGVVAVANPKGDISENFVPFSLTLSFPKPSTATGKIILKKDNPSGLPEYDDQIEVPIIFSSEASE
jgi:cell division protein FtsA